MYTGWSPPNLVGRKMGESHHRAPHRHVSLISHLNAFKSLLTEIQTFYKVRSQTENLTTSF